MYSCLTINAKIHYNKITLNGDSSVCCSVQDHQLPEISGLGIEKAPSLGFLSHFPHFKPRNVFF